jgi:ribosomal-protein-alanine N-acetyltransferase
VKRGIIRAKRCERVTDTAVHTTRLELRPLPATAADALPDDREAAARLLGVTLSAEWPQADLLDVLPRQAAANPNEEPFGVWVIIERESATVIGDIGFTGPPGADRTVEIGYSVTPDRRGRGYATEAARALVDWAFGQPQVGVVVAGCDMENVTSVHILERIGFVRTEETNGQLRWRLQRRATSTSQGAGR